MCPSKLDLLGRIPKNGRKMADGRLLFQALGYIHVTIGHRFLYSRSEVFGVSHNYTVLCKFVIMYVCKCLHNCDLICENPA